jgi:hypothetical protein
MDRNGDWPRPFFRAPCVAFGTPRIRSCSTARFGRYCRSGRLCRAQYCAWFRWPLLPRLPARMTRSPPLCCWRASPTQQERWAARGVRCRGNAVSLSLYVLCSVVGSLTSSIGARRCAPCSLPCLACVGTNSQPHGLAHAFLDVERREESQRSAAQHRAGSPRRRCRPAACKRAPSAAGAQPWLRAACPLVSGRYFSFLAAFPSSSLVYIANLALLTTTLPSSGALP